MSKEILPGGGSITVPITDVPAGRALVAVAGSSEGAERAAPVNCTVGLARWARPLAALAQLTVDPAAPRWNEAIVSLPRIAAARLKLFCDVPAGSPIAVHWARPIAIPETVAASPPLVVLVSLDTLRADYVEGFGAAPGSTPNLEQLGAEGVRATAATSESTWTLHSHFAMLFSRLYGFPVVPKPLVSLAEALAAGGFATIGLTGGGFMAAEFEFHRGFDHYLEHDSSQSHGSDLDALPALLDEAIGWMRRLADVPTFLFVHTYAVHELTPDETAWHKTHGEFATPPPTPALVASARRFYADLVRETDAALAPFVAYLREASRRRPVLVIVTSDHGEAFGEHDNFRHGWGIPSVKLYDELVHIPFIVWGPGMAAPGLDSQEPVMLADIAPSVLAAQGLPLPPSMVGRNLWPLWSSAGDAAADSGRESAIEGASVSHTRRSWSLRSAARKLIVELGDDGNDEYELYDLENDPGEERDLAATDAEAVAELRTRLRDRLGQLGIALDDRTLPRCPQCEWVETETFFTAALSDDGDTPTQSATGEEHLAPATRDRLRALGYLE